MTSTVATNPVALPDPATLPDDVPLLKAIIAELVEALQDSQRDCSRTQARLQQLLQRLYGKRSERLVPGQGLLFADLAEAEAAAAAPPPPAEPEQPAPRRRRYRPHGRQQLPDHLPCERRVYELSAAEQACPCCGLQRLVIGAQTSKQLDYQPASLHVIEHVRLTYACPRCQPGAAAATPSANAATPDANSSTTAAGPLSRPDANPTPDSTPPTTPAPVAVPASPGGTIAGPLRVVGSTFATAAKPPQPIAKGLAGPGMLAHVIVSKYSEHLPLYRLAQQFARQGVPLARSTLCDWLGQAAQLLLPLYTLLKQRLLQARVVQTDDTPVCVQEAAGPGTHQGRVWVYLGDIFQPYWVFAYTPTREADGPCTFLQGYQGYLQADAYSGYDQLFATGRVVEVGCWAHARRKFYEARTTDPVRATYVLGVIRQLYQVERDAGAAGAKLTREEQWQLRRQRRQEQAKPLLTTLCQWLKDEQAKVLPKSPIAEAIGYALNQWAALQRYLDVGWLNIDNNAAERALRPLAVGRTNWLFFGSDGGGQTAAVLYSLVQTCKGLGVEPWAYLRDVLERLPALPAERLEELLPDRWAAAQRRQAQAAPPEAAAPAAPSG